MDTLWGVETLRGDILENSGPIESLEASSIDMTFCFTGVNLVFSLIDFLDLSLLDLSPVCLFGSSFSLSSLFFCLTKNCVINICFVFYCE